MCCKRIIFVIILLFGLHAKYLYSQPGKLAVQVSAVSTLIHGDPSDASPGIGGEVGLHFKFTNHFSLAGLFGYSRLNGVLGDDAFQTMFLPLGLKLRYNFKPDSRFNIYLDAGYGVAFSKLENDQRIPGRKESEISEGKEFTSLGLGFEYFFQPELSFSVGTEYYQSGTDFLDFIEQFRSDRVASLKLGVSYHFGRTGVFKASQRLEIRERTLASQNKPPEEDKPITPEFPNHEQKSGVSTSPRAGEDTKTTFLEKNLINEKLDLVLSRIQAIADDLEALNDFVGSVPPNDTKVANDFYTLYQEARSHFEQKNYTISANLFKKLLNKFPQHRLASNCQYWLAECYYGLENYQFALPAFQRVLAFPNKNKADDAQLKITYCYRKLNLKNKALEAVNVFLEQYPGSEFYSRALAEKEQLAVK